MEKILSIDLSTQTAPTITETAGKNWIEYGTNDGDYPNLYPQFLIDLYYNSSTHAAIINATRDMIAGEGIIIPDNNDTESTAKLNSFIKNVNGKESLHDVVRKLAFDYKLQGGFAINVIWNKARTAIASINHIAVEKIRVGKPNELGEIDTYYVSSDWSNIRKHKPIAIPAFNMNDRTSPSQIIYDGDYSPSMDIYYTPDYSAACNWALVDQHVAEFHLSNIKHGFSGSYFVNFSNGIPTREERLEIERSLVNKFAGSTNSGKIILTFSDGKDRVPEITPISVSNADKQYLALQELLVQNILTGHRVTSPMLMGIKNETGLGSNVDELNTAFEVYLNTVVKPYQNRIINCLTKIFSINKINVPIEFIQNKPITTKFTLEDLKSVMTQDEIREELGLSPLESSEKVEEDEFSKVGSMITDGEELPLFDTIEEAEAEAKRIGCSGHHEHTMDGKTYYMPCEDHGTAIELESQKNLENFIKTYGEDNPNEDWQLLSDEIVEDEHTDFNFEKELNDLHKVEFAISTGDDNPDMDSTDEGTDREFNYYKVRYRYATAISSSNTRPFCKAMLSANKLYRKEDIEKMSSEVVNFVPSKTSRGNNKGMGPNGSLTYDVFKYKGGVNCGHYFRREIYFYQLGIGTGTDIEDATRIITTTEARARGFYPETNAPEVSRAPKNMPNNGRLN